MKLFRCEICLSFVFVMLEAFGHAEISNSDGLNELSRDFEGPVQHNEDIENSIIRYLYRPSGITSEELIPTDSRPKLLAATRMIGTFMITSTRLNESHEVLDTSDRMEGFKEKKTHFSMGLNWTVSNVTEDVRSTFTLDYRNIFERVDKRSDLKTIKPDDIWKNRNKLESDNHHEASSFLESEVVLDLFDKDPDNTLREFYVESLVNKSQFVERFSDSKFKEPSPSQSITFTVEDTASSSFDGLNQTSNSFETSSFPSSSKFNKTKSGIVNGSSTSSWSVTVNEQISEKHQLNVGITLILSPIIVIHFVVVAVVVICIKSRMKLKRSCFRARNAIDEPTTNGSFLELKEIPPAENKEISSEQSDVDHQLHEHGLCVVVL